MAALLLLLLLDALTNLNSPDEERAANDVRVAIVAISDGETADGFVNANGNNAETGPLTGKCVNAADKGFDELVMLC